MTRPPLSFEGRAIVVTGAGSGIGRALALHAAREGMNIAICDRDENGLEETARFLRETKAQVMARATDVTDVAAMSRFAADVGDAFGNIALLFANAGVLRLGSVLDQPLADWRLVFEVNVLGVVATVQAFAPKMLATGAPAQIVITGSTGSFSSAEGFAAYCGTKHALVPLAEELRRELAARDAPIGVSLLMPGAVSTHIFNASDPGRTPQPDTITPDAAAAIAFAGAIADHHMILTHPAHVARTRARFERIIENLETSVEGR